MRVSTHEYHSMWGKNVNSQLLKITECGLVPENTETILPQPPPLNRAGFWRSRYHVPPLWIVDFWRTRKGLKKFNKLNVAALSMAWIMWRIFHVLQLYISIIWRRKNSTFTILIIWKGPKKKNSSSCSKKTMTTSSDQIRFVENCVKYQINRKTHTWNLRNKKEMGIRLSKQPSLLYCQ